MATTDLATLRSYRTWFIIRGVATIALGALAVVLPVVATAAMGVGFGLLLLASGALGLAVTLWSGSAAPGFRWNALTAALALAAGIVLLWFPRAGAITLAIILAAYFFAGGLTKLVTVFSRRRARPGAWLWTLLSGVVDLSLSLLIVTGWLGMAAWVIGVLVGVHLIADGLALLMSALQSRDVSSARPPGNSASIS
jgi:uncharacterized membrane protein HdeD (DUF308 family)